MPNLAEDRPRASLTPAGGEIVCHCEWVTRGEIEAALGGPLPAGDLGGLKRRTRCMMGRCQGFYCSAQVMALARRPAAAMTNATDVLILGGGPAGLSAARALRGSAFTTRCLLERESELGGIPRHCGHLGFGLREFGKVYSGPDYAKRLADEASGADLKLRMTALKIEPGGLVRTTGPNGPEDFAGQGRAAGMGARETPRSARLISGARPFGVMNTGALQQFVYLHGSQPVRAAGRSSAASWSPSPPC